MLHLLLVLRLLPFEDRVSTLFQWLSLPEEQRSVGFITATGVCRAPGRHGSCCCCFRPDFYALYLDEPDSSGHRYGPASSEVRRSLWSFQGRRVGSKFSLGKKLGGVWEDVTSEAVAVLPGGRGFEKSWWNFGNCDGRADPERPAALCQLAHRVGSRWARCDTQKHRFLKKKKLLLFIKNRIGWCYCCVHAGMEEASCERGVFVSNYLNNSDEFSIIPGPAARIRPSRLPENFFSCEFSCTQRSLAHRLLFVTTGLCFSPQSTTRAWWTSCRYANYPKWEFSISERNEGWASRFAPSVHDSRLLCVCVCVLKCRTANQTMTPYLKENLPKRLHFAYNNRIERGHLYMKSGWQAALWVSAPAHVGPKWGEKKNTSNVWTNSSNQFKSGAESVPYSIFIVYPYFEVVVFIYYHAWRKQLTDSILFTQMWCGHDISLVNWVAFFKI